MFPEPPKVVWAAREEAKLDKPGPLFWLVALLAGPLVNASVAWAVFAAHSGPDGAPDVTLAALIVLALLAVEVLVLRALAGRAGIPRGRRVRSVVRDGVVGLVFATGFFWSFEAFVLLALGA